MGGSISKRDSEDQLRAGSRADLGRRMPVEGSLLVRDASFPQPVGTASAATTAAPPEADVLVPAVFRWEHGGNQVYITGTFNGWSCKVPMHRSGNDWTYIQTLPKRKHAYKFIVDDEWRFAPDQATIVDGEGNINNYLDLTNFTPDTEHIPSRNDTVAHIPYDTTAVDEDEYTKDPPMLPPHLRHITLNAATIPEAPYILPVPQHVTLNHLYCTTIRDKLMVQGITQRYRSKFVTTVYYSIMPV